MTSRPVARRATPVDDRPIRGIVDRSPPIRIAMIAVTAFFTIGPLISILDKRPEPAALALVVAAWAAFGVVLLQIFRVSPFGRLEDRPIMLAAAVFLAAAGLAGQVVFGLDGAAAMYYYAGVTAARLVPQRLAWAAISVVAATAGVGTAIVAGDTGDGLTVGVTVGTISLTLAALSALGRTNRALHAARQELADAAVAEERARIARDLHDTLGHSLSLIALKSELARRVVAEDPERAAAEMAAVEQAAREALAVARETVSGYRQPSLALELAGARETLRVAGLHAVVEPAPDGLPPAVDALLAWAVREGVTNVVRHSGARTASIRVTTTDGRAGIEIVDDGGHAAGLDAADNDDRDARRIPGAGLSGLRERAVAAGGRLEAGSVASGGYRLALSVPLEVP